MYRIIGEIIHFNEIPWGKEVIVSGSIGRNHWFWHMKGVFKSQSGNCRFENEFGMSTHLSPDDFISLNVLEKVGCVSAPEVEA